MSESTPDRDGRAAGRHGRAADRDGGAADRDGGAADRDGGAADRDDAASRRGPYVESTIIMTTVRVVLPFVFTFGLFVLFHGADSSGGGFQGGVILGASVVMVAFAFGIDPTRRWLDERILRGVVLAGVAAFLLIGLGAVVLGGSFLEYAQYDVPHASKYGIEAVEIAIGAIVSGGVVALFFALAGGVDREQGGPEG